MGYFARFLLTVVILAIPYSIQGGLVDDIFYQRTLINNSISADPFLQKYYKRNTQLTTIEKREIVSTLSDTSLLGLKEFGYLINYAILLDKCDERQLRDYYLYQIKTRYQQDPAVLMTVYLEALRHNWNSVLDIYDPILQRYRLVNHYNTIYGLSDIVLTHVDLSVMDRQATASVVDNLRKFNSVDINVFFYKFLRDIVQLRFANITNDFVYIWTIFTKDFYNFNMVMINLLKFVAGFLTLLFIIFSLLILIRRRKLVYHFFMHYLPKNAPLGYHRLFAILGFFILYSILGIIGVVILFGLITVKYLSIKERRLLAIGGIFFLINILIFQAVYFLYVPLNNNSPYFTYYKSYIEGFNPSVFRIARSNIDQNQDVHPLFFAAAAHQERKRENYFESLRYWNEFEKRYGKKIDEVELNKANLYFLLNDNKNATVIYDRLTSRGEIPEAFYNMAKIHLVNFEIGKYNDYVNRASSLSNVYSIPKYIDDNNRYLGSEKASNLLDVSIPNSVMYEFLWQDAFNSKYTISGFRQFFVFAKIFIIIFFILYCLFVRKKILKLCKVCGMQICYDCQTKDMICPICNTRLENVKSRILQNKIKLDLANAAKIIDFKIVKITSLIIPGAYYVLNGMFRFLSFFKIILVTLLLTLLFFTFETLSIYRVTSFISFNIKLVATVLLLIIFIYNALTSVKKFRIEKESITKSSGF